ncbi:uncharacterized protein LOC129945847 [Eupeodes corollae]|uniref:uncharacterized protein LOC129945847 n=1 Tax=Eupeodes corollae TaxID=290404 RepID=UPI002491209B|nr:uncharacterized protein LOC129945847 [Eupeodes corollae]
MKMQGRKKVLEEDHDAVSHFIWCVRKRPALYNYKLPREQRRRADVARIWQELASEIGNITAVECRKKWKNLRDTYHQYRLRKLKYKECLEKWRYTADLSFLTDIYQPKLISERANYLNSSKTNNNHNTIQEVKTSDISSLIELDEETTQDSQSLHKEYIIDQNDFDDEDIEHVSEMDENEMQFCEVTDGGHARNVEAVGDDTSYGEVYLYDETETNGVAVDSLVLPTNQPTDSKENILKKPSSSSGCTAVYVGELSADHTQLASPSQPLQPSSECLTIGDKKDELDLFFQFLKTKIQNLPSVDITAIQIEFLNAVLRREAANYEKEANTNLK